MTQITGVVNTIKYCLPHMEIMKGRKSIWCRLDNPDDSQTELIRKAWAKDVRVKGEWNKRHSIFNVKSITILGNGNGK